MPIEKTLPPTYVLIAIMLMVVLHLIVPAAQMVPGLWKVLGVIPLALGIAVNIIADKAFSKVGTTVKPFQESTALITTGVYRISRHPMYLGIVLIVVGIAVILGSLTAFVVPPVLALLLDRNFITVEERMLEETFGPTWLDYKKTVRRWI